MDNAAGTPIALDGNSKKVSFADGVLGFVLALLAMGLPMIGVTVNLSLGVTLLVAAFVLLAHWFWNLKGLETVKPVTRTNILWASGFVYFGLTLWQSYREYRKDHSHPQSTAKAPSAPDAPVSVAQKPTVSAEPQPNPQTQPRRTEHGTKSPAKAEGAATQTTVANGATQNSGDGGCTQNVIGGNNNVNNCTPRPVSISDAQAANLAKALSAKPLTGTAVVVYEMNVENGAELAGQIKGSLDSAGVVTRLGDPAMNIIEYPHSYSGLSFDGVNDGNAAIADALEAALLEQHIITTQLKRNYHPPNGDGTDPILIYIKKP